MNRVTFTIIEKGTNVQVKPLQSLYDLLPNQIAYTSQKFPVYPITIIIYLENPPFNKFSISFAANFNPSKGVLYGSEDGKKYTKFLELQDLSQRNEEYIKIFKDKLYYCYVKLVLEEPANKKDNICKQIKLKGIQFSLIHFYQTRFACSLQSRLTYHPTLFRLLQILEYKALLLKQNKNKLYQKYEGRLEQLLNQINSKKFHKVLPDQPLIQKWSKEVEYLQNEPIYSEALVELPNPVKIRKDIYKLQKQLKEFQKDRFGQIRPHVMHYFQKYFNTEIKEGYLRLLSSDKIEDLNRALVDFWNDVKILDEITVETQEAIIMFFNFYIQFIESPLKISVLKIMILFAKRKSNGRNEALQTVYQRVLFNLIKYVHQKEDEELYNLSLRYCYILFDLVNNETFLKQLLNAYKGYEIAEQIEKLEILEKLTFRNVKIFDKRQIVDFLIQVLLHNGLNLTDKNRAYNVIAYLASLFGKAALMKDFQKLNSMILMSMEKIVDSKLALITSGHVEAQNNQQDNKCEFCGVYNANFKDENLKDLHLAKQCKFITTCNYCQQNVEIPELFKHYVQQCKQKHSFKHCDNCFEVIEIKNEDKHNEKCEQKLQTRCPLCYQKVENKLRLKEHILVDGCPNNPR